MYFSGKLSIDPSHLTEINVLRPTRAFGRVLHLLTAGRSSPKEEQETFTAIAILQQINRAMREMNVTNVVRLAKDEIDFYFDEQGKKDDMQEALDGFNLEVDALEGELFGTLTLVTEHDGDGMKYLIEVDVHRTHPVGGFPITVKVNAVPTDFQRRPEESPEQVRARMDAALSTAEDYESYVTGRRAQFDQFLDRFDLAIRTHLKSDEILRSGRARIVRPRKGGVRPPALPGTRRQSPEPLFHGYYGFGDVMLTSMLWSSFLHDHHYPVSDVDLVDDSGNEMLSVGDSGFTAGETDTLNPEADFVPPQGGDIDYSAGHAFDSDFEKTGVLGVPEIPAADSGGGGDSEGGWLSGISDSWGGGDSSSDGGSSCGSSCGGGCGGD